MAYVSAYFKFVCYPGFSYVLAVVAATLAVLAVACVTIAYLFGVSNGKPQITTTCCIISCIFTDPRSVNMHLIN